VEHPTNLRQVPGLKNRHSGCGAVIYAIKALRSVWTAKEAEARLPQTMKTVPKALELPQIPELRKQKSATDEFEDWLRETEGEGVGKIVRR
jgi:hypothetical protein